MDDCRNCQTSTATPAEPGDLSWRLAVSNVPAIAPRSRQSHASIGPASAFGHWDCRKRRRYLRFEGGEQVGQEDVSLQSAPPFGKDLDSSELNVEANLEQVGPPSCRFPRRTRHYGGMPTHRIRHTGAQSDSSCVPIMRPISPDSSAPSFWMARYTVP